MAFVVRDAIIRCFILVVKKRPVEKNLRGGRQALLLADHPFVVALAAG